MTFEEMQQGMKEVKDNLIVQGQLLNRLDQSMIESRRDFDERINALLKIAESHEGQIQELRAAMQSLFAHMDRFIRGLETDGHGRKGES